MDWRRAQLTQLTDDRALDLEPRYSPDGKYLYFVSDRTGVYNLYAYELADQEDLAGHQRRQRRLRSGHLARRQDRWRSSAFSALGYDARDGDARSARRGARRLRRCSIAPTITPPPEEPRKPTHATTRFRTLFPWTFAPVRAPDGYGEILGFNLAGSDVVGRHSWNAARSASAPAAPTTCSSPRTTSTTGCGRR